MATEPDTADDAAIAAALADEEPPTKMAGIMDFEKRIDGDDFVGCRLRHYWAGDNAWYFARILTFDHEKRLHIVLYDDGEVHEVNLLDSNELYMIGRGCYVVKMPGHSPWPCMEWECCQALEDAGTMRMWNRRTPSKMFIIYFGGVAASAAPSRHLHESSPGMMDVGGLFFEFEPFRTASHDANRGRGDGVVPRPPRRRRHDHASVRASRERVAASTRRRRREHARVHALRERVEATPRRRDAIDATVRVIQRRRTSPSRSNRSRRSLGNARSARTSRRRAASSG